MKVEDSIVEDILEISSQQRLGILLILKEKKTKLSSLAKQLDATASEIHRNLSRLTHANMITKDSSGNYLLTTYGQVICKMVPVFSLFADNKKFFEKHSFGNLPEKFVLQASSLSDCRHIEGYVRVNEEILAMYRSAEKFIYNVLFEVSYDSDTLDVLTKKVKSGVVLNSVFLKSAAISKDRKRALEKTGFLSLLKEEKIQRRITEDVNVLVIMNEKKAGIMLPTIDGQIDVREMLVSDKKEFCQWCQDYFEEIWKNSTPFNEKKLNL